MAELSDDDKRELLKLARTAISDAFLQKKSVRKTREFSQVLMEKRGCFVTLHKKGLLRGCIGTIQPGKPLYTGVEDNALHAAFEDPRFPALKKEELPDIDIEISVLTVPQVLDYKDSEDLLNKLKPGVHGVILSHEWQSATFLPQVWEQLPDKVFFWNSFV